VLAAAGFLVALLVAAGAVLPVPYVLLGPGPMTDTLGSIDGEDLIRIEGRETFESEGQLELTTVSVSGGPGSDVELLSALQGWWDPDVAVVPVRELYPPGQTAEEVDELNTRQMDLSQTTATAAALRALDIPVEGTVVVAAVQDDAPATGQLEVGDVVTAVDGEPVDTAEQLRAAVVDREARDPVEITFLRDGEEMTETITTAAAEDGRPVVGVLPGESFDFPFEVEIALDDVGGPSAGLMFALGIVDKLTPEDITGGAFVAGTGTIDGQGNIGPIGGIQQKIAAAADAGADIFLAPAANCAAAAAVVPEDVRLVRVESLASAREALEALRSGEGEVPSCTA
jgi:PDZ domain-containing protein